MTVSGSTVGSTSPQSTRSVGGAGTAEAVAQIVNHERDASARGEDREPDGPASAKKQRLPDLPEMYHAENGSWRTLNLGPNEDWSRPRVWPPEDPAEPDAEDDHDPRPPSQEPDEGRL